MSDGFTDTMRAEWREDKIYKYALALATWVDNSSKENYALALNEAKTLFKSKLVRWGSAKTYIQSHKLLIEDIKWRRKEAMSFLYYYLPCKLPDLIKICETCKSGKICDINNSAFRCVNKNLLTKILISESEKKHLRFVSDFGCNYWEPK